MKGYYNLFSAYCQRLMLMAFDERYFADKWFKLEKG